MSTGIDWSKFGSVPTLSSLTGTPSPTVKSPGVAVQNTPTILSDDDDDDDDGLDTWEIVLIFLLLVIFVLFLMKKGVI